MASLSLRQPLRPRRIFRSTVAARYRAANRLSGGRKRAPRQRLRPGLLSGFGGWITTRMFSRLARFEASSLLSVVRSLVVSIARAHARNAFRLAARSPFWIRDAETSGRRHVEGETKG